jgi:hypothetical protein
MGGRARAAQDAPADGLFNKKEEEISSFPSLSLTHFLPSFLPPNFLFFSVLLAVAKKQERERKIVPK